MDRTEFVAQVRAQGRAVLLEHGPRSAVDYVRTAMDQRVNDEGASDCKLSRAQGMAAALAYSRDDPQEVERFIDSL